MTQKSEANITDLLDTSDSSDISNYQSRVSQYYTGRNVLITGGSGFLGILLIERLLRCCPGIRKMYVLIREKKGKQVEVRIKEHFDNIIYDRLKKEQPHFITKVIMVEADFNKVNLGLSPENRKRLLDTNIIFHMAASIRFTETIRVAVNVNIRGPKEMLLLAREMPNLEAFVHVSTAYSNCVHKLIDEKFYPPPLETDKILTLLDILDDEKLQKIIPTLLGKWPNIYVYTKAIGEDAVRQYSVGLPVCIVRPSIVTATAKEPISGWVNKIYGPMSVIIAGMLGIIRTVHGVPENTVDMIPADYVIANIIVVGWDIAKRTNILPSIDNANTDVLQTERTPIYNCVSSAQNPINADNIQKMSKKYILRMPTTKVLWYYMFLMNRYRFVYEICVIFLHIIPAAIVDVLAFLTGRKPMLLKLYNKIYMFNEVTSYFIKHQWQFCNESVVKLWDNLNPADRQIFDFNVQNISWEKYFETIISGCRTYVIKDSMDTVDQARVRYKKLKIAHYTLLIIGSSLVMWAMLSLVNFIISFFL